ncbi:MAG TPA: ABC transporter permease subunit [Stellaceae bacterium]|nr:ABC transporter permease subunit [Stellaceae bacterium]
MPYAVFLLRQHFMAFPRELLDAAAIDGAGHWRRLWSVVLPVNRPAIAAASRLPACRPSRSSSPFSGG